VVKSGEKIVTIFGSANAKPGEADYQTAETLGNLLARAGFVVANGGYGGTMPAAAKGARDASGQTVGVTCSAFPRQPNEYISRVINTASLDERLDTLISIAAAYILLPGGTGTLMELAKVWELKNKGFLSADKPIILIGGFWMPLVELIAVEDPCSRRHLQYAQGPDETAGILIRCTENGKI